MPPKAKQPTNKKTKQQTKKAKKTKSKKTKPSASNTLMLTKPAYALAKMLADPDHNDPVGIPDGQMLSSRKFRLTQTFNGQTGSGGFGFILPTPCSASDGSAAYYSGLGYVGSSANPLSANNTLNTGVYRLTPPALPVTTSQSLGSADAFKSYNRLVMVRYRVRYIGSVLNEGGVTTCYEDPDHNSCCGMGISDITSKAPELWEEDDFDKHECVFTLYPVNDLERNPARIASVGQSIGNIWNAYPFSNGDEELAITYNSVTTFTDTVGSVAVGTPPGVIMIQSAVADQPFRCKVTYVYEYGGALNEPYATSNSNDIEGTKLVYAAAQKVARTLVKDNNRLNEILKWVYRLYQEIKPIAIPLATRYLTA